MIEQMLLRLTDDEWKAYSAPILTSDGPKATGDKLVDDWERQLEEGTLNIEDMNLK